MFFSLFKIVIFLFIFYQPIYCERDKIKLYFEVENNQEFCLHHQFNDSLEYVVEYGVLKGGNFDIDFYLESPQKVKLYSATKIRRIDIFNFNSGMNGVFKFCFSNSFSTLTHKVVYFDLKPMNLNFRLSLREEALKQIPGVITATESILNNIYFNMLNVSEIQEFYRREEAVDLSFAKMLNAKIPILSFINFTTILFVSFFQTLFLKCLFRKQIDSHKQQPTYLLNTQLKM